MRLANSLDKPDIARVSPPRTERGPLRHSAGETKRSSRNEATTHLPLPDHETAPQADPPAKARTAAGYRGGLRSLIIILKSLLIVAIVMPLSILTVMMCILSIEWIVFDEVRMTFLM